MNHRIAFLSLVAFSISLSLLAGCEKEEKVTSYAAPKDPPPAKVAQPASWTAPAGWQAVPHDAKMQDAAFVAGSGEAAVKVTVSNLSATAPGARDLLQNVNRWRRQLAMAPVTPTELDKLVRQADQAGEAIQIVDLASETGQRMRAMIVPREDRIWFFKMTGTVAAVEGHKGEFDAFVRSAQYTTAAAPPLVAGADAMPGQPERPPQPTTPAPQPAADELTFATPPGWKSEPNANPMRVATLSTGGEKPAQLIVSRLSSNFGGMTANLTRWRAEVGLPPAAEGEQQKETPVKIGTVDGSLIDLIGPGKNGSPTRSLIARCTLGDSVWFFKIVGPVDSVTQQQKAFETFLASVRLPGGTP